MDNENFENYFYDSNDPEFDELKPEAREEIKRQSMENTYTLIINNYDFDVFPNRLFWLLTDFDELTVFDVLVEYFKHPDREEYEKCAMLLKIKERHKRWDASRAEKKGKFTYKLGYDEEDSPLS